MQRTFDKAVQHADQFSFGVEQRSTLAALARGKTGLNQVLQRPVVENGFGTIEQERLAVRIVRLCDQPDIQSERRFFFISEKRACNRKTGFSVRKCAGIGKFYRRCGVRESCFGFQQDEIGGILHALLAVQNAGNLRRAGRPVAKTDADLAAQR